MQIRKTTEDYIQAFGEIATYELLYLEYITNKMSLPKIKEKYGLSYSITLELLRRYDIPKRTAREAGIICFEQTKNTWLNKYGVDNVSKVESIKDKKKETSLKNYGVDNIWKLPGYRDIARKSFLEKTGMDLDEHVSSVVSKIMNTPEQKIRLAKSAQDYWDSLPEDEFSKICDIAEQNLIKHRQYLLDNPEIANLQNDKISKSQKLRWDNLDSETRNKYITRLLTIHNSKIEKKIYGVLWANEIKFEFQKGINDKFWVDFLIDGKIIIEAFGDYWHANPDKFKTTHKFYNGKSMEEIHKYDKLRKEYLESHGYVFVSLWENEIYKMTEDDIASFIKKVIYESSRNNNTRI